MKNGCFFLRFIVLLVCFLCCFTPQQIPKADHSPIKQSSTLQVPPDLVYPLVRRWLVSSLFDHTNPGNDGSQDGHITIWTGDSVSDDPNDPYDQSTAGSVSGYTDYDSDLRDLRWNHFDPGWLWYDRHYGYDSACSLNTPVGAATSGTAYLDGAYAVRVVHSSGYRTFYRHLNQRIPQTTSVQPGRWIGDSGNEGGLLDPHLHFEMRDPSSRYIDPFGWEGGSADPWQFNVGNVWASGDPIPIGYRDQSHTVHGPYALDYSQIRQKWFDLDGEPGSPLGDDYTGTAVGQGIDSTTLLERIQCRQPDRLR
jgi:hypothetical protein